MKERLAYGFCDGTLSERKANTGLGTDGKERDRDFQRVLSFGLVHGYAIRQRVDSYERALRKWDGERDGSFCTVATAFLREIGGISDGESVTGLKPWMVWVEL